MLDTVIVGAGFAGLSAARTLMAEGHSNFVILEARDRVGGRAKPGTIGDHCIDLGGMWMAPTQTRLRQLAAHYGIHPYPTHLDGNAIFRIGKKERQGTREDLSRIFGLAGGLAHLFARWKLDRLMAPLEITQPWAHPEADRLDATTVETWIARNVLHPTPRAVFRTICTMLLCAEPSNVSLLFFLHYLKSGGGLDVLISSDAGGAQNFLFHGGVHQISRFMADEIGERLYLNAPVSAIEWRDGAVEVHGRAGMFAARKAIIAVPPTLLTRIGFTPALPQPRVAVHERLVMGSSIKFWVLYRSPFWRARGLNGTILRDDVPARPVMDVSPPGQDQGLLVGFFDGAHAVEHADLPVETRRAIVLGMLAEHFGPEALQPLDYVDHNWIGEEWSGGCYGAYAPPGVFARYGERLRTPFGPLHWAGTEIASEWTGYIEGAVQSGERAAGEILKEFPGRNATLA